MTTPPPLPPDDLSSMGGRRDGSAPSGGGGGGGAFGAAGPLADIAITEIDLDNTLLLDAVNKGKARFVSDCASYLQVRVCVCGGRLA